MKISAPHWLIAILAILAACAPTVGIQFPKLLPYATLVGSLVPIILGALGVLTGSVIPSINVAAVARDVAIKAAGVLLLALGIGSMVGCAGVVPTPQTQAVITAAANLALCVEGVYQHDESLSPPAALTQIVLDEGVGCASQAIALVTAIGQTVTSATQAAVIAQAHSLAVAATSTRSGTTVNVLKK